MYLSNVSSNKLLSIFYSANKFFLCICIDILQITFCNQDMNLNYLLIDNIQSLFFPRPYLTEGCESDFFFHSENITGLP